MLQILLRRIRDFFAPADRQEIDAELRFHLEQQIEVNVAAGMSHAAAKRQAMIDFGSMESAREQTYRQRPRYYLGVIAQDIRHALRGFDRSPTFAIAIIATLMLGIGATTAVLSVVDRILFRPLPYFQADRLVSVGLVQSLEPQEFMVGGFFFDWRDRQRTFETLSAEGAVPDECDLSDRHPVQLSCASVAATFLPMLGVVPILGRNFLPEEDRPHGAQVALLTYGLWSKHYNRDPSVLNRTIKIDGDSVQVVGVLPKDFELPSLHTADIILPLVLDENIQRGLSPGAPMRAFARLRPGVSIDQARVEIEPLYKSALLIIPLDIRKDFHLRVRSLRDRQMQEVRPVAWIIFVTALAVLLIACANIASLLLARGAVRGWELAVRSALGASRSRLAHQALTESLLLSLAGALGGILLAELLIHVFRAIAPPGIPYFHHIGIDLRIVLIAISLSVICGLAFGLVPALKRPSSNLLSARSLRPPSGLLFRKSLVVLQIAVSMVLLTGAALLARSFWNLSQQDFGVRTGNIITVKITLGPHDYSTSAQILSFFEQASNRLRFGPGVTDAAVVDSLPPSPSHNQMRFSSIGISGRPPAPDQAGGSVTYRWVSPDYFHTLGIRMLRGPGFTNEELNAKGHFVVLSQTLAQRLFPGANPLGERLELDRAAPGKVGDIVEKTSPKIDFYRVVGVSADVKNGSVAGENLPEYYRLRRNNAEDWQRSGAWGGSAVIALRTILPPTVVAPWIHSQISSLDPTLPVDIATMQQRVSLLEDGPRFQALLTASFAVTGLFLAIIGMYGVIALLVTQRTQEIGVRMALGASRRNVLYLILQQSLRMVALGLLLGLFSALAISHVLSTLLFSVGAHDPITFFVVTILLALVTSVAAFIPAHSATRVDPVVALRYD